MRFLEEDNGNCRVYYRDGAKLYCWQDDGSWGRHDWRYYVCSRDGEPSYQVQPPPAMPLPPGETSTGKDLIAFLSQKQEA